MSKTIETLPQTSGVYLMKNVDGKVIYVGKAVNLRKRVQSYFKKRNAAVKTDMLVQNIRRIDHIKTDSEAEALILEASLIKKYQPKYNISLRDDKTYPFIEITSEDIPRVLLVRPRRKNPNSEYFGPYTQTGLIREALSILRRIFPFRTCDPFPGKVCLDYHMGLCDGPCEKRQTRRDYLTHIRHVRMVLQGRKDALLKSLTRKMERFSARQKFEEAAKVRDQIRALGALYSGTQDLNVFKETEQLQRALNLAVAPSRIETFDISHTFGNESVGAMVSFFNGKPDKQNYRKFRIKTIKGIDDFSMIAEVVRRRYTRLKKENRLFPDLIVIDGGKGQLSSAYAELQKIAVDAPIVSIAKREEEVFCVGKRKPVILARDSLGLKLLQRCRDEAHRFAISYHRKLRGKKYEN